MGNGIKKGYNFISIKCVVLRAVSGQHLGADPLRVLPIVATPLLAVMFGLCFFLTGALPDFLA